MFLDFISAILLLPFLFVCFYAAERVINRFVQKKKREEKMRIIRNRHIELAIELAKCA